MCGIFASVSIHAENAREKVVHFTHCTIEELQRCLQRRGPDHLKEVSFIFKEKLDLFFIASVLHLRGSKLIEQPAIDEKGNLLLWNGEIFGGSLINTKMESDTHILAEKLFSTESVSDVLQIISSIEGPYAFIFLQANGLLWFGRDIFGRRSLVWNCMTSTFQICSVSCGEAEWEEVPATGIFCINLNHLIAEKSIIIYQYPWSSLASGNLLKQELFDISKKFKLKRMLDFKIQIPIRKLMNKNMPTDEESSDFLQELMNLQSSNSTDKELLLKLLNLQNLKSTVDEFEIVLSDAVKKRVENELGMCKKCYLRRILGVKNVSCDHASIGVLFSGGLDSIIIACIIDRHLPIDKPIDLINVAFGNTANVGNKKIQKQENIFDTPDRITGRNGLKELKDINPARKWNFIEVNVSNEELAMKRKNIISQLLKPSFTVLDDSIGCALWFASQGCGFISVYSSYEAYISSARVLLVGMGADEQLAGYSRYRTKFKESGWNGLVQELSLELDRIGSRNLGRDDRIIADSGVESRYPFLDENVVSFLNALPVWLKANLYFPRGVGEKLLLRLLAFKLGLTEASVLPKRAIQFGSRIAKIENNKEKGSDVCDRLTSLKC